MTYPDAPRLIPATLALLEDWTGPVDEFIGPGDQWAPSAVISGAAILPRPGVRAYRLDPMRAEVRDHLLRRLSLPDWMRDDGDLAPWESAALIACAASGRAPSGLLGRWTPSSISAIIAIARGCAIMDGPDAMLLPWGDGTVWRWTR
jgi:hypothetical protein